jgi:hypothetical protein
MINRDEILRELNIDQKHNIWEHNVDNWASVEVFKEMTGKLPEPGMDHDAEMQVYIDFLRDKPRQMRLLRERGLEFGSMYLTAKRFLYRHL